ncbi:hypothetical protein [Mageeibacillus indolicus]|nr:hypothetical protein [Mageeibacillus indolicus]
MPSAYLNNKYTENLEETEKIMYYAGFITSLIISVAALVGSLYLFIKAIKCWAERKITWRYQFFLPALLLPIILWLSFAMVLPRSLDCISLVQGQIRKVTAEVTAYNRILGRVYTKQGIFYVSRWSAVPKEGQSYAIHYLPRSHYAEFKLEQKQSN